MTTANATPTLIPEESLVNIEASEDLDEEFLSSLSDRERKFVLARIDDPSMTPKQLSQRVGCSETRALAMWKEPKLASYISRKLREMSRAILEAESAISTRLISKVNNELIRRFEEDSDEQTRLDAISLLLGTHGLTDSHCVDKEFSPEEVRIILKSRLSGLSPLELVAMRDKLLVTADKILNASGEESMDTSIINVLSRNYLKYGKKASGLDIAIFDPNESGGFKGATTFLSMRKTESETDAGGEPEEDDKEVIDSSFD